MFCGPYYLFSNVFKPLGQNLAQSAQMFRGAFKTLGQKPGHSGQMNSKVFKPIGQTLAHSGHTTPHLLGSVLNQPGVLFLDLLVV